LTRRANIEGQDEVGQVAHTFNQMADSLQTYETGRRQMTAVSDNGPGIPSEDLPKLFDRFWRAEKSRSRVTGGSGLGLAVVKQMAEAHGGRIAAQSAPGQGARFNFSLPA
jgi:two-component system sensor histidine kinase BaeS